METTTVAVVPLPFFWTDFAAAKSVFYSGVGWLEDADVWCEAVGEPDARPYRDMLSAGASGAPAADAEDLAMSRVAEHLPSDAPLRVVSRPLCAVVLTLCAALTADSGTCLRDDAGAIIGALTASVRANAREAGEAQSHDAVAFLAAMHDSLSDSGALSDAARSRAFAAVAISDARRWLRASGVIPWEGHRQSRKSDLHCEIEMLRAALHRANQRADALSEVIHRAGITEGGRRVAVSTIRDASSGICATSVAAAPAAAAAQRPTAPAPSPAPAVAVHPIDLASVADATVLPPYRICLKLLRVEAGVRHRPPSPEELRGAMSALLRGDAVGAVAALRAARHAVEWLTLCVRVEGCERVSRRRCWTVLNGAIGGVVALLRQACDARRAELPVREVGKLERAMAEAAASAVGGMVRKRKRSSAL